MYTEVKIISKRGPEPDPGIFERGGSPGSSYL